MKIVCISDTHLERPELPDGDLLVHTGDLTYQGLPDELRSVNRYFMSVEKQFKHGILFIAGNHDFLFEKDPGAARNYLSAGTYLKDSGIEIEGIKFWGTPWVKQFYNWAFMAEEDVLAEHYAKVPDDTNVLLCHGPAYGVLDLVKRGENTGSISLMGTIIRVQPELFVFGHIHEQHGQVIVETDGGKRTLFVNAAICNDKYKSVYEPFVIDLSDDGLA